MEVMQRERLIKNSHVKVDCAVSGADMSSIFKSKIVEIEIRPKTYDRKLTLERKFCV